MASYTTYTTLLSEQLGGTDEQYLITFEYGDDFTGDGLDDIRITIALSPESNSGSEDVLGVAFDIQGDAVDGLQITDIQTATDGGTLSSATPSWVIDANMVGSQSGTDPGFNTSGGGSDAPYDAAVTVSAPGAGEGIVQSFSFVLTNPDADLDAEALLENTDWWVRTQSTDGGEGSAKTGGFIDDLPPPNGDDGGNDGDLGDGMGNTPGFWKNHAEVFLQETGLTLDDSFEALFGVDVIGTRKVSDDPSLGEALGARGGGEAALLRAATAGWANAVSDDVNYVLDRGALELVVVERYDLDPESLNYDSDLAGLMTGLTDTLDLVDNNADGILDGTEIIDAVRDIYDAAGASGDDFGLADTIELARALDIINNMPSVETADFFA